LIKEHKTARIEWKKADDEVAAIKKSYMDMADHTMPPARVLGSRTLGRIFRHPVMPPSAITQLLLARQDPIRKERIADRQYFAEKAQLFGNAVLVEIALERESQQTT